MPSTKPNLSSIPKEFRGDHWELTEGYEVKITANQIKIYSGEELVHDYKLGDDLFVKKYLDKYYFNFEHYDNGRTNYFQAIVPEEMIDGIIEIYNVTVPEEESDPFFGEIKLLKDDFLDKYYTWYGVSETDYLNYTSTFDGLSYYTALGTYEDYKREQELISQLMTDDAEAANNDPYCLLGNCENGWGVKRFTNGNLYCGFFNDSEKHYFGVQFWKEGGTYLGTWYKNNYSDKKHGIEIWPNGSYNIHNNSRGSWAESGCVTGDCEDGWGVYIYESGGMHVGFWDENGEEHLLGIHFWGDGDFYLGLYNHGDRETSPQGYYSWNTGNEKTFFGDNITSGNDCLLGDCYKGWGAYRFESGNIHIGFWEDGVQDYLGFKFWRYSDFFFGLYKDSERLKRGMYFFEDGTIDPRTEIVDYE